MTEDSRADRRSPVGEPVVRSDPAVTGDRAADAVEFDPDDPESVAVAAETVTRFATGDVGDDDNVLMLRGAAACAALVRGVGSYKAAAERTSDAVSVAFIRKWARVHDLPQSVRRHVARGSLAPTAAKHIARVHGEARLALAWGAVDGDLTVPLARWLPEPGRSAGRLTRLHIGEPLFQVLKHWSYLFVCTAGTLS